jgi:pimeloyl-ACP methyl ester carboxylesterase
MTAAAPISRFVVVNGARLHCLDYGGDGPPAVLHHATGFHAWMWTPIAAVLTRRYRVFALDARGHGDSDKPSSGYRWAGFVEDLTTFVEGLELGRVLGIGHSLGGSTMIGAAADRSDLFVALALLDPILFPREFRSGAVADNPMAAAARRRREFWTNPEEVLASYRGRGPFGKWTDEALCLYVEHGFAREDGGVRLKCPPAIEAQVFSMEPLYDLWLALERIQAPTLLMRGEESEAFSANDSAEALRRLPRGDLVTIPQTTHTFPMEVPGEVGERILAFAAGSHEAGGRR